MLDELFPIFAMPEVRDQRFTIRGSPGCASRAGAQRRARAGGFVEARAKWALFATAAAASVMLGVFAQTPDADLQPPPMPPEEITPAPPLPPPVSNPSPPATAPRPAAAAPTPARVLRTADVAYEYEMRSATSGNEPAVVVGRPADQPDYGREGNRRAAVLRSRAPETFDFDRSSLRDVLRLLADKAGIPWIGIDEQSPVAQRLVTFKMTTSPFAALQSVARQNGIRLSYEDGVWFMGARSQQQDKEREEARKNIEQKQARIESDNELVGVVYQLKHDPVDLVDFRDGGSRSQTTGSGTSSNGLTTPNMPLQYSQRVFQAKAPRIVNDVRNILGMSPLQYNPDGTVTDPDVVPGGNSVNEIWRQVDAGYGSASTDSGATDASTYATEHSKTA